MSKHEWAKLLASLHDDHQARREALLMLSDEDWVADSERGWLRQAASRKETLQPGNKHGDGRGLYWSMMTNVSEARCKVPPHLIKRMGAVNHDDYPTEDGSFTRYRKTRQLAWLDLLNVLEATP